MKNRALTYTIGFASIGLIITLLISFVQRKTLNTYQHHQPYISLGDVSKNHIVSGALLEEKIIGGDKSLNFERDVLTKFAAANGILHNAYDGKSTELGVFEKSNNEDTKALLKEAANDSERLMEAAKVKWQSRQQRIVESTDSTAIVPVVNFDEPDQAFNAAYTKSLSSIDAFAAHEKKMAEADTFFLSNISWLSIIILAVSLALVSIMLYRIQRTGDQKIKENEQRLALQSDASSQISGFIEAVSSGNYTVSLELAGDDGSLTNKLITMRDKIKENAESERKRGWSTMGQAQIGEILRTTSISATELYDNIIRFIVKYTKSNQGGLFIINEDLENQKVFLDLVACYAFERKKFLAKTVDAGEGLIGQCFLEGERIYLKEVPKEYVTIGSGLGASKPKALLIVPLKLNGKNYGAIELATFTQYEDYEIELIEKLAESIASTISTVRTNESTRILLETTQQQAEEMKSQEEEIRQNMEELEATQEEMRRKQTLIEKELAQSQQQTEALKVQEKRLIESQDTLQAIVDNIPRAIFWKDKDLRFMGCNKIFADIAGLISPQEVIGKTDFDMIWSSQADSYRKDDLEVMTKRTPKLDIEEVNVNSEGTESWVLTSKVPIVSQKGEVVAILGMFEDITDRKQKQADIEKIVQEHDSAKKEIQELRRLLEIQG